MGDYCFGGQKVSIKRQDDGSYKQFQTISDVNVLNGFGIKTYSAQGGVILQCKFNTRKEIHFGSHDVGIFRHNKLVKGVKYMYIEHLGKFTRIEIDFKEPEILALQTFQTAAQQQEEDEKLLQSNGRTVNTHG
ncbi:hypothetical protein FGO68_gene11177 [Halteria grandinella]|uniref:Uncharacterized protein n=1 Tax=Halteria grandinella TaxID=5974 RepID=A0A8J8SXG8_HALGN|nr:hypothetical protein FGO68_gene11177 [Halteria grandinella]